MSGTVYRMMLKDKEGRPIGLIRLSDDGTFSGELSSGTIFRDGIGELIKMGFTEGIVMYPIVTPATEACRYTFSHTRNWCGNDGCRES